MIWYSPELNELLIVEVSNARLEYFKQISFLLRCCISEEELMSGGWFYVGTL